jgi:SAM-dependent methyltransferase
MSFDAEAYRQESLEGWEAAAPGWVRRGETMRRYAAPVSHEMLDALSLQPGERVLELAGGVGETGMLAAELVAPGGRVIISDQAEAMLEGARARALELGLGNVEFRVLNAEWIDLPLASVDAVLCRWGYMLMADPAAALGETRRVLASGGRLAFAVWDSVQSNPWALLPAQELIERGLAPAPRESSEPRPGPWAPRPHQAQGERGAARARRAGRLRRGRDRGARAASAAHRLRRAVGDDARSLARLPRRGALAARGEDGGDQDLTGGALRALHRCGRSARDTGAHARRLRQRLTAPAHRPRQPPI